MERREAQEQQLQRSRDLHYDDRHYDQQLGHDRSRDQDHGYDMGY